MGLDFGPEVVVSGLSLALQHYADRLDKIFLVGDESILKPLLDQYDLQRVYAESRPNVDMDIVKSKLKEEYDMAMGMREVKESLTLEGEQDMRNIEEMKEEGCR